MIFRHNTSAESFAGSARQPCMFVLIPHHSNALALTGLATRRGGGGADKIRPRLPTFEHGASAAEKIGALTQLNFCILTSGLIFALQQSVPGKVLPCLVTKRVLHPSLSAPGQTLPCEPRYAECTILTNDTVKYSGCPNHTCAYLRASQSLPACHTWRFRGDRVILQQHQHQHHGQ